MVKILFCQDNKDKLLGLCLPYRDDRTLQIMTSTETVTQSVPNEEQLIFFSFPSKMVNINLWFSGKKGITFNRSRS